MLPCTKSGMKIQSYWVGCFLKWFAHLIELTATEPMDHNSLVTSQAMYADDDDSVNESV